MISNIVYFSSSTNLDYLREYILKYVVPWKIPWKIRCLRIFKNFILKCFRSDNRGEYTLNEFVSYCATHEIRHEQTFYGTPQHNGVAERMNRTIAERVRYMLRVTKRPKSFRSKTVRTVTWLIDLHHCLSNLLFLQILIIKRIIKKELSNI